jgi:murein DD-endopeptidase MepM/ murein hydrolase activator NlpD
MEVKMGKLTFDEWLKDAQEHGMWLGTRLGRLFLQPGEFDGPVTLPVVEVPEPITDWRPPVGSEEYPPAAWYVSVVHDLTGKANGGYRHTGIDLNVARQPFGDVDRGQPVWAVADGVVYAVGYSDKHLGSVVVKVRCAQEVSTRAWWWQDGAPRFKPVDIWPGDVLFVRYWHLENDVVFQSLEAGQEVQQGQCLGHLGNYTAGDGGDHLHFDMALSAFEPQWWFTLHEDVLWLNPLPILAQHMGPALVDLMVSKELG